MLSHTEIKLNFQSKYSIAKKTITIFTVQNLFLAQNGISLVRILKRKKMNFWRENSNFSDTKKARKSLILRAESSKNKVESFETI